MNDGWMSFALREWGRHMRRSSTLTALLGCGVVLALVGPFGTDTLLGAVPRLLYWMVIVFAGYGLGALGNAVIRHGLRPRSTVVDLGLTALSAGFAVLVFLLTANAVVFGWVPKAAELVQFAASVMAISAVVSVSIGIAMRDRAPQDAQHAPAAPVPPEIPPLMERIALERRGTLLSLSVEDHYVRIRTSRGEALVLMRLSDAIRETGAIKGAQVHRSHWVAFDAVQSATRRGDRALLTLRDGVEIPVSRAHMGKIKEAGLLPR